MKNTLRAHFARFLTVALIAVSCWVLGTCKSPAGTDKNTETVINIAEIEGVTAPAAGGNPVTAITETEQYRGSVTWDPSHSTFAHSTRYTATITLTAKTGYTLQGVEENFFTVAEAISVTNVAIPILLLRCSLSPLRSLFTLKQFPR